MDFGLLEGGKNGEYNGVGVGKISKIFATQDVFFFEIISVDNLYHCFVQKYTCI